MTAEIIKFPKPYKVTLTDQKVDEKQVLEWAIRKDLDDVLVIGVEKNGDLYFASAPVDTGRIIYLLEKAKKILLEST